MIIDVHLGMDEASGLILNGLDHSWMAVTGVGDADAAGKVQVTGAFIIPHVGALASVYHQIGNVEPNGS